MAKPYAVLVGMPGAGKTTIGRRLAQAMGLPLVDSDQRIEVLKGAPCGAVFSSLGEPAFRQLEAEVIAQCLSEPGVLSLGGGAVTTPRTRELLRAHRVVWIDVSIAEGVRRTQSDNSRPVLQSANPQARYRQLVAERTTLFAEVATLRVRTDGRTPQQVVAQIQRELAQLRANAARFNPRGKSHE